MQGARSLLGIYNGSVSKALVGAFPNIGLDSTALKSAFSTKQQHYLNQLL